MLDSIKIKLQYWLPKLALTRLAGWGADKQAGWLTQLVVKTFARYYRVDMQEAQNPDLTSYATFNDFFVRPLRDGARPIIADANWLALPADGAISQLGPIREDQIFQAKGHHYSLEALLAGNYLLAEPFRNGLFATTYLAPRDYHRVHMPCAGVLREMIYVPGDLFSVNPLTAANVPNLFARNERLGRANPGGATMETGRPPELSNAGPTRPPAKKAPSRWKKAPRWAVSNSAPR